MSAPVVEEAEERACSPLCPDRIDEAEENGREVELGGFEVCAVEEGVEWEVDVESMERLDDMEDRVGCRGVLLALLGPASAEDDVLDLPCPVLDAAEPDVFRCGLFGNGAGAPPPLSLDPI